MKDIPIKDNKIYYIIVYPSPNYWRHFIIQAIDVKNAVNSINYNYRQVYKEYIKEHPEDRYHTGERIKHVVIATRRWKRIQNPTFGSSGRQQYIEVYDVTDKLKLGLEGHLNIGDEGIWNILPKLEAKYLIR